MFTQTIPSGPFATNAYVVGCEATHEAIIIDPAPGSFDSLDKILKQKNLKPLAVWLTHSHWDHIADASAVKKAYHIPILVHDKDAFNLQEPGTDGIPSWMEIEGVSTYTPIQEGDKLGLGTYSFDVIATPGHTPGGVCFYCPEELILFSGDTLFKGTIGNVSFSTGSPKDMWVSLKKLAKLPRETKVYPGHGPRTTIGAESWLSNAEEMFGD